jgi:hypothetical protein
MLANATVKARLKVENLVVGVVTTVTTAVITVTVAGAQFVAGDCVLVTPRSATGLGAAIPICCYGVVLTATTLGICFPNASAGPLTPSAALDYDILVFGQTGSFATTT